MGARINITRREAIGLGAGFLGAGLLAACRDEGPETIDLGAPRIAARPKPATTTTAPGQYSLDVAPREALLYVPTSYDPATAAPAVVMLHGAGGGAQGPINLFKDLADTRGLILISCKSNELTWDAIRSGRYDADPALIDKALRLTFDRCNVDGRRLTLEGFSDGATYAIGLGRANGDLFSKIAAFSAGFLLETVNVGKPAFFVSHGSKDDVLPVSNGREISTALRRAYDVIYEEFDGGHTVPPIVANDAVTWMTQPTAP